MSKRLQVILSDEDMRELKRVGILQGTHKLSARDALHLATMRRHDVWTIMSFDSEFDGYPGLVRLPSQV